MIFAAYMCEGGKWWCQANGRHQDGHETCSQVPVNQTKCPSIARSEKCHMLLPVDKKQGPGGCQLLTKTESEWSVRIWRVPITVLGCLACRSLQACAYPRYRKRTVAPLRAFIQALEIALLADRGPVPERACSISSCHDGQKFCSWPQN